MRLRCKPARRNCGGWTPALPAAPGCGPGAALITLVSLFLGFEWNGLVGYPLALAGVAAFILLVRRHDAIETRQKRQAALKATAEDYLARAGDGWKSFPRTGREFQSEGFPTGRDLDIFGRIPLSIPLRRPHASGQAATRRLVA